MLQINKVLISDDIDPVCPKILKDNGIEVALKTKLSKEQLLGEISQGYDALLVRSATKVTKDVISAADNLKLIGRAGTGVDNIDVPAATRKGAIVMNTPAGNSRSAAELACAMVMCLARQVPQAHESMKKGKWERKQFMGNEVYGKTLAIIGLGRIGREVAARMQAFGMTTVGFDPLVSAEQSASFGVKSLSLEEIWPVADYVTLHVPLIPATQNLVNKEVLSKCKPGVKFVNCARGGVIDEADLVQALDDGKVGGAAFDVFLEEPPTYRPLIDHPKVIATPHLGASTKEAQVRVAREIAEQIVALNRRESLVGAINAASVSAVLDEENAQLVKCMGNLAQILQALCSNDQTSEIKVQYPKGRVDLQNALTAAAIFGFLNKTSGGAVNLVNAQIYAKEAGITVTSCESEGTTLSVCAGKHSVSGCPSAAGTVFGQYGQQQLPVGLLCRGTLLIAASNNTTDLPPSLVSKCLLSTGAGASLKIFSFPSLTADQTRQVPNTYGVVNFE